MLKYFDNTFYKFLFGFLLILSISFGILYIVKQWGGGAGTDTQTETVQVDQSQN
jgi:hypothetical protein